MIFDEIISLGSNCSPSLSLRDLELKKETYPFDWVRSNTKIIYHLFKSDFKEYTLFPNSNLNIHNVKINPNYYLQDLYSNLLFNNKDYIINNNYINYYGQYFGHYTNLSVKNLINKFKRYITRLKNLLKQKKNILFIHSNEEFIYHKQSRDYRYVLYEYLCKINDLILVNYPNINFVIINIDFNNKFKNYKNIINIDIDYNFKLSDYCENHIPVIYDKYRNRITKNISTFLKIVELIKSVYDYLIFYKKYL